MKDSKTSHSVFQTGPDSVSHSSRMHHMLWIYVALTVLPAFASDECDMETIREKVNATNERLRRTDYKDGHAYSKQTCQELEILFSAIESRIGRCADSERNRLGLLVESGRMTAELKCRDALDSEAKTYINCLRNYNHSGDQCSERLRTLKDQYKEYSEGLTNTNDVCCAYHSYHKCLGDRLSNACGEDARQHVELYADKLTNRLLYNFCRNYETSVCVDVDPSGTTRLASAARTALTSAVLAYVTGYLLW
ncbi:uncharacterized protein LOC119388138 isoform X2 [Rhipicephalus sanguineus]|uniref:uncharacterized protein LOC119388138 isoform X2 n=2 Tax=Rhipicephalus sanguineus TaxID=34632 RepID=UPI0018931046|nr:uncharacterized protein LOC119388138 isoform X2 [Rhipicephalus sanguineus]